MLEKLFLNIVSMSLTASYVIVCIMILRLLFKKAPKVISYAMWSVAAFRLICPISFESIYSLIPRAPQNDNSTLLQSAQLSSLIYSGNNTGKAMATQTMINSVDPMQVYIWIGTRLWLFGIILMLCYSMLSMLRLKKRLKGAQSTGSNIFEVEHLDTPFVLGIRKARIFLPSGLEENEKSYILRHEQTHIRRFDYIIKPIAFFILSLHWFNPFVWLAFVLMSTDMELSCDERVIREMGGTIRKAYSSSLLSLAAGKHFWSGSPLAFGEGNVSTRIKNVLNYRKPPFWIIIVAIIAAVTIGTGLMANPKTVNDSQDNLEAKNLVETAELGTSVELNNATTPAVSPKLLETDLETCIHNAILSANAGPKLGSNIATEAHTILGTVEKGDTTTVYAMALYMEFIYQDDGLENSGGSHMPVAITFTKDSAGAYKLKEYWIPQDGSSYVSSIRKKFPADISKNAIDTQKYILAETQSCYAQAVAYKPLDLDKVFEKLLETICSSPAESSNPQDYIKEHPIDYREMMFYGSFTLQYCFGIFEKGGQTGLKGQIMASACKDILGKEGSGIKASNGQEWFDKFKEKAEKLEKQYGGEYLKKHKPGSWILLLRKYISYVEE